MTRYRVVWRGPIGRLSGLGIASRAYVQSLRRLGVDVRATSGKEAGSWRNSGNKYNVLIYHHLPYTLNFKKARKQFHAILLNTVWETTRIPKRWRRSMNKFDAVCVPSTQNLKAMRNSGVKVPLFIVPHGVNSRYSPIKRRPSESPSRREFVFLSVFGFQHRKNPETLLRAFWQEFSPKDHVTLVIKTNGYAPYENTQWIRRRIQRYKSSLGFSKKTARLTVIARHLSNRQMRELYYRADVFVLPTRGEGVGLPFLEAMSSGLPVIATSWGGQMDFLSKRNSFLIPYKLKNPVSGMNSRHSIARKFRSLFSERGQLWAEVDVRNLRRQMRLAYRNPSLCKKKGLQGRRDSLRLTWGRAGRGMKQAIERTIRAKK
ncbi:glycosyltransferase [Paenibacillus albus]|uniref:Glycosyltransferase n=1 Tax=Paenibacillus albus TaxID=2495582 RepID=A0A3Q8X8W6_9BACL|nr:glycosyltransferase [Paenibacillus albus]AZN42679.1 glycosyltransferase [Paenibacillus albus]